MGFNISAENKSLNEKGKQDMGMKCGLPQPRLQPSKLGWVTFICQPFFNKSLNLFIFAKLVERLDTMEIMPTQLLLEAGLEPILALVYQFIKL